MKHGMSSRPLIGITSYAEEIRWGVWTEDAALVPLAYVRAVDHAGGRPLVVPPSEDGLEETLEALDGVIFSGGGDVDPTLYDAEPHPETDEPRGARDAAELRMLQAALDRDMPVLAICRGSASTHRSSHITTRATAGSARASVRSPGPRTASSRVSRIPRSASRSASSGTPKRARTSRSSRRSSTRRARTGARAGADDAPL